MRHLLLILLASLAMMLTACSSTGRLSSYPDKPLNYTATDTPLLVTPDGLTLVGQWWHPENTPKAVILLIHGTALNAGFYKDWARYANQRGYAVFGVDLRSWGQSQGYGKRGYVGDYREYLTDIETAANYIQQQYPDLPLFLQGESLGGGVALMADISGRVPNRGLILNAPAVQGNPGFGALRMPQFLANFGLNVLGAGAHLWPSYPLLPSNRLTAGIVFIDKDASRRFVDDPHNTHSWLPAFYVTQTNNLMKHVRDQAARVQAPLLIQHGTRDRLVPLKSSEWLMEHASSTDKTLKTYQGLSHAALHVDGNQQLWADAVRWLDQQLAQEVSRLSGE